MIRKTHWYVPSPAVRERFSSLRMPVLNFSFLSIQITNSEDHILELVTSKEISNPLRPLLVLLLGGGGNDLLPTSIRPPRPNLPQNSLRNVLRRNSRRSRSLRRSSPLRPPRQNFRSHLRHLLVPYRSLHLPNLDCLYDEKHSVYPLRHFSLVSRHVCCASNYSNTSIYHGYFFSSSAGTRIYVSWD